MNARIQRIRPVSWSAASEVQARPHNSVAKLAPIPSTYVAGSGLPPANVGVAQGLISMLRKATIGLAAFGAMAGVFAGTADAASTVRDPLNQMSVYRDSAGALVVEAGPGDDNIEITRTRSGAVKVTINGSSREFAERDAYQLVIRGGDGNDTIRVDPRARMQDIELRIEGGAGDDLIFGGAGHEVILGGDGNDRIDGGDGNDLILGGAGDDVLEGGRGRDILIGGGGNDRLSGGEGDDYLDGGTGDDYLSGGPGRDVLLGGRGVDQLVSDAADRAVMQDPVGNAGHRVVIRGSAEFVAATEEALDTLRSTPSGRAMLETIDATGRTVVIQEFGEPQATANHVDTEEETITRAGRRGAGTDVGISWNPSFRGEAGGEAWANTPPAIILGHELIHAFNSVTGSMPRDGMEPRNGRAPAGEDLAVGLRFQPRRGARAVTPETYYRRLGLPVVTENTLRRELGLPIRPRY